MKAKSTNSQEGNIKNITTTIMSPSEKDSLSLWLQERLLSLGLDADIYTKYIMGILTEEEDEDIIEVESIPLKSDREETKEDRELHTKLQLIQQCLLGVTMSSSDVDSLVSYLLIKLRKRTSLCDKKIELPTPPPTDEVMSSAKLAPLTSFTATFAGVDHLFPSSSTPFSSSRQLLPHSSSVNKSLPLGFSNLGEGSGSWLEQRFDINSSSTDESYQTLIKKFNPDIASLWSPPQQQQVQQTSLKSYLMPDHSQLEDTCLFSRSSLMLSLLEDSSSSAPRIGGARGSTGNIWSFSPSQTSSFLTLKDDSGVPSSSSSDLSSPDCCVSETFSVNSTSLKNHTPESLFVRFSPSRSSNDGSNCGIAQSSLTSRQSSQVEEPQQNGDNQENLLTSARTHFQPIRQDFYERDVGNVIDTLQTGLVPCSGKCPNHARNRVNNGPVADRPPSASREELSQFVGPFPTENEEVIEEEKCQVEDVRKAQVDDKKDVKAIQGNVENDTEGKKPSSESVEAGQDDYDAICLILNQVLNHQSPLEEEGEDHLSTSAYPHSYPPQSYQRQQLQDHDLLVLCDSASYHAEEETLYHEDWEEEAVYGGYHDAVTGVDHLQWSTADDESTTIVGREMSPLVPFTIEPRIERTVQYAKPCTFFLEGNCRKADCKFSHDINNITCKYWMEGFCFKGDQCPFLHDFVSNTAVEYAEEVTVDDNKSKFTIDSEQDFPTLGEEKKKNEGGGRTVAGGKSRGRSGDDSKTNNANGNPAIISTSLSSTSSGASSHNSKKRLSPSLQFRNQLAYRLRKGKKKAARQKAV